MNRKLSDQELDLAMCELYANDDDSLVGQIMQQIDGAQAPGSHAIPTKPHTRTTWLIGLGAAIAASAVLGFFFLPSEPGTNDPDINEQPVAETTPTENEREVVLLELPSSAASSQQLPLSAWLPDEFLAVTARLKQSEKQQRRGRVRLAIDRVLHGAIKGKKVVTKDELPNFHCSGPIAATDAFPRDSLLLCWLIQSNGKWSLAHMQQADPRTMSVIDAVLGEQPCEDLKPIIEARPGLDYTTVEMIKLFDPEERTTPLLEDIVQQAPERLEPLKGVDSSQTELWGERSYLVSAQLAPAVDLLCERSQYADPRLVDWLLPCFDPLQDEAAEFFRFSLVYALVHIAQVDAYGGKPFLSDAQRDSCRRVFLQQAAGVGQQHTLTKRTACDGLAVIGDQACIDRFLLEMSTRPATLGHTAVTSALFDIIYREKCTEEQLRQIKAACLKELQTLDRNDPPLRNDEESFFAAQFADGLAGVLFRSGIDDDERATLQALYDQTEHKWMKNHLERFFRK